MKALLRGADLVLDALLFAASLIGLVLFACVAVVQHSWPFALLAALCFIVLSACVGAAVGSIE